MASAALLIFTDAPAPEDFAQFYQASKLAPNVNVYELDQLAPYEHQLGMPGVAFLRPLWFTFFVRPFTLLPFRTALFLWRALTLAACAGFALMWTGRKLPAWLALAWSLPLCTVVAKGQDTGFLLLCVGAALSLIRRKQMAWAGLVIAILTVKMHLFVLVPVVLLRHKLWRAIGGAAAGTAVLLAASFAMWPSWVPAFIAALHTKEGGGNLARMFNVHGMLYLHPRAELALSFAVLVAGCVIIWRADLATALGCSIVCSILIGGHAFVYDALLWIPAGLVVIERTSAMWARLVAILTVAPFVYVAANQPAMAHLPVICALALVAAVLYESLRYLQRWSGSRP